MHATFTLLIYIWELLENTLTALNESFSQDIMAKKTKLIYERDKAFSDP